TIEGWGGEAGARVIARLRKRAEHLEADRARLRAMEGELTVHTMRAEFDAARPLSADLLALAERLGDPAAIANAHGVRSAALFNCGEVEGAHHHAERTQALFDPAIPPQTADSGILASIMLATTCGYRGRVVQARAHYLDALARAEALGIPFQRGLAINLTAQLCAFLNDAPGSRRYAEEAVRLASEHDFSFLRVTAVLIRGRGDVRGRRGREGGPAAAARRPPHRRAARARSTPRAGSAWPRPATACSSPGPTSPAGTPLAQIRCSRMPWRSPPRPASGYTSPSCIACGANASSRVPRRAGERPPRRHGSSARSGPRRSGRRSSSSSAPRPACLASGSRRASCWCASSIASTLPTTAPICVP